MRIPCSASRLPWLTVAALALFSIVACPAFAVPSAPPETVAICVVQVDGECFVKATGGVLEWAKSPGATRYKVCRSVDTSGWGGCDVVLANSLTDATYTIPSTELPADGFERAYYVSACDGAANSSCTKWSANVPAYVRTDRLAPAHRDVTTDRHVWVIDDGSTSSVTVAVDDGGVGVREIQASINRIGSNVYNPRGLVSWRGGSLGPRWPGDQVACAGGGWASKNANAFNPNTVTLVGCTTSEEGDTRTVSFELRAEPTFGQFGAINDVAAWADDYLGQRAGWTNFNLNFRSRVAVDVAAPSIQGATTSRQDWVVDDDWIYEVTVDVEDLGDGVKRIEAVLHGPGGLGDTPRGRLEWDLSALGGGSVKDELGCQGAGGRAAMDAFGYRPTTLTLVGCRTELSQEVRRSVTFTLRPNATFGILAGPLDLAVTATDGAGNVRSWVERPLGIASRRPGDQPGDGAGYAGLLDVAGIERADAEGIGVNIATLLYQRKQCTPHYWRTENTAGITAAYRERNVKAMVIVENFLFHDVNDMIGEDCAPLDPPPPLDPSACWHNQKWRLLPDWQERLDEFVVLHGAYLTPDVVEFFLVSSEVNDRCFDMGEVERAAQAIHEALPGIPLAMLYGATYDADGVRISQPPPASFPAVFEVVGLFSYGMFDVTDPLEPRNATASYFDPENPENPATVYGDLLSKLDPNQKVMLIFDASLDASKTALGWEPDDLAEVALSYADFMLFRPEVTRLGGFTWQGLLALPQSVKDSAAKWICEQTLSANPICALGVVGE